MVLNPDKAASSFDIASLLDLLNNSEGDGNEARPAAVKPAEVPKSVGTKSTTDVIPPAVENDHYLINGIENEDNRFVAHIVYGLSKLMRT